VFLVKETHVPPFKQGFGSAKQGFVWHLSPKKPVLHEHEKVPFIKEVHVPLF